jgi:hypothetical protein
MLNLWCDLNQQVTIQSGQTPTVLQQLCSLPDRYFEDPKLSRNLLPTLIAATYGCPENQDILTKQDISPEVMLDNRIVMSIPEL